MTATHLCDCKYVEVRVRDQIATCNLSGAGQAIRREKLDGCKKVIVRVFIRMMILIMELMMGNLTRSWGGTADRRQFSPAAKPKLKLKQ